MKFTCVFLLAACLTTSAKGVAQTVSLNERNVSLEKVFKEINRQTGFNFLYNSATLKTAKKVTITVNNVPLEKALQICFNQQSFDFVIADNTIVVRKKKSLAVNDIRLTDTPSTIDVNGRIVDENGEPVAASVMVKGTSKGTTTNDNGEFELKGVDDSATLVITGVSIESFEVKVNGRTELTLNARLKNIVGQNISVEINTGYQRIPKERATGSFTFIDNKTLNEQTGPTILDRLKGVASGVLFDDSKVKDQNKHYNFSIHGLSTINGSQDPLIVVDDFPYEGKIENINPNDVENVTILKDAAAASIWGTRAGNGVIVITTKKGKFNKPLTISLNSNITVSGKPDLFSIDQIKSSDYIDMEKILFEKGYFNSTINSTSHLALTPVVDILNRQLRGEITAAQAEKMIDMYRNHDVRNDYQKYLYRNAVHQQYSLNLNGGSHNLSYNISGGIDKDISNLNANNNRFTASFENNYQPFKSVELTARLTYTDTKFTEGRPGLNSFRINSRNVPYIYLADAGGTPLSLAVDYRESYTDTAGGGHLLSWKYYPLTDYTHTKLTNDQRDMLAFLGVKFQVFKGMSIDVKYQYERQGADYRTLQDTGSYFTRYMINQFSQLNTSTGEVKYIVPLGGILNLSNAITTVQDLRAQLNYNKDWQKSSVAVIGGEDIRKAGNSSNSNTVYGYNDDFLTVGNTDFLNPYPNFIGGYSSYIGSGISLSKRQNNFVSFFGNAAYTYLNRYTLSASFRKDASNLFGVNTNDKWNPFWSAGIAWNISKEAGYHSKIFPYLKLRATYGFSGNVDQSKSAVTVLHFYNSGFETNLPFAQVSQFANPDLSWEKVRTTNIGIDFSIKRDLLSGSIEFYQKKGTNLFGITPIDYTSGLGTEYLTKNVAEMKGRGVDVIVQTKNIDRQFKWSTGFLFSYTDSRTSKYYNGDYLVSGSFLGGGESIFPLAGYPLYSIGGYEWAGLDPQTGDPRGFLDGKISTRYDSINIQKGMQGVVYNGPSSPRFYGSVNNTFSWKQFSLSVNLLYNLGYYFRRDVISYSRLITSGLGVSEFENRWQQPGDEAFTNVPSFKYPADSRRDEMYRFAEINVGRADNIRLQYINLAYNFIPRHNMNLLKNVQLYVNIANIGIVWRANHWKIDPEYQGTLAPQTSYTTGLRANF